ncbi:uncharacterized protein LOC132029329 [Lycium ferocissimum]|uniref:uncharacterized protein LOC132029329 n=1 Tax=Lycium ferocissimum TaxID=112874 RepID=UPI002815EA86|nr:uncharacterized protein LOC132029329 [Lycium ferocissimum]
MKMRVLAACVMVGSATAISSSTSSFNFLISRNQDGSQKKRNENYSTPQQVQPSSDKFAPRFDGLRFIETLITAHR